MTKAQLGGYRIHRFPEMQIHIHPGEALTCAIVVIIITHAWWNAPRSVRAFEDFTSCERYRRTFPNCKVGWSIMITKRKISEETQDASTCSHWPDIHAEQESIMPAQRYVASVVEE